MAILDFDRKPWIDALGGTLGVPPDVLILEGTWWRARACEARLRYLDAVTELPFPDIFVGTYKEARVAYCCAYGAARAVEPAQIFAQLGTPLLVQIGTCGVLTPNIVAGAVTVPRQACALDGVSQHYGASQSVAFDAALSDRAEDLLRDAGCVTHAARHLTWPSLFAQSDEMCADWARQGLECVDMEASAVAAVAARYGRASVAMLVTWDLLSDGRTFLDPLPDDRQAALDRANTATFEVALELGRQMAGA